MPGRKKSAPNLARPVTLSMPSCLTGEDPTILSFLSGLKPLLSRIVDMSGPSHFLGGSKYRANDLVVAGAAAQVAGEPIAHFGFGRIGAAVEQRLGGDQDPRRADAALRSIEFEETALQRMQFIALRHALDGFDLLAVGFDREDQARTDHGSVDHDGARAAIAGAAAFLGAGQHQFVAENVKERLLRLAQILVFVAIHGRGDVVFPAHEFCLARSSANEAARFANTPATLMRYSLVPRLSSIGRHAAAAACARRSSAGASRREPTSAAPASSTRRTVGATAPSDTRAAKHTPSASSVTLTPTPTTAMSISVRGVMRRYASPEYGGRGGNRKEATISPLRSEVLPGPIGMPSTGTSRVPSGPATRAIAPAAIRAGTLSAAGEALQRLPPMVARPLICMDPINFTPSTTPGHVLQNA